MLKLAAIISAVVAGFLGVMIYASPRATDQLSGKLIIAAAIAIIGLALFVDRPWSRAIMTVTVISVAALTCYILLKWSGRL